MSIGSKRVISSILGALVFSSALIASQASKMASSVVLSSCQADLTGDGQADVALALGGPRTPEVVALVSGKTGTYQAFVLSRDHGTIVLSCERGATVTETKAGGGTGKLVKTPGYYVLVGQPEGAKAAYVWNGKQFEEVWISD